MRRKIALGAICLALTGPFCAAFDDVVVVGDPVNSGNIAATQANTAATQANTASIKLDAMRSRLANQSTQISTALANNNAYQSALQRLSQINQTLYQLRQFTNPGQVLQQTFGGLIPAELMKLVNEVKQLKGNAEALMDSINGMSQFNFDFEQLLSSSPGAAAQSAASGGCSSSSTCTGSRCDVIGNVSRAYAQACAYGCTANTATGKIDSYDPSVIAQNVAQVDAKMDAIYDEIMTQIMYFVQTDQEFYEQLNEQMSDLMADMTKDRSTTPLTDPTGTMLLVTGPTNLSGVVGTAASSSLSAGQITPDQDPITESEKAQWQARLEQMQMAVQERQQVLTNLRTTLDMLQLAQARAKSKMAQFYIQCESTCASGLCGRN